MEHFFIVKKSCDTSLLAIPVKYLWKCHEVPRQFHFTLKEERKSSRESRFVEFCEKRTRTSLGASCLTFIAPSKPPSQKISLAEKRLQTNLLAIYDNCHKYHDKDRPCNPWQLSQVSWIARDIIFKIHTNKYFRKIR